MGKGYHPSRLTPEAINKVIETEQAPVAPMERSEVTCARTLIKNGQDWNRPELTQRGIAMLIRLAYPVQWEIMDVTLLTNRRNLFVKAIDKEIEKRTNVE